MRIPTTTTTTIAAAGLFGVTQAAAMPKLTRTPNLAARAEATPSAITTISHTGGIHSGLWNEVVSQEVIVSVDIVHPMPPLSTPVAARAEATAVPISTNSQSGYVLYEDVTTVFPTQVAARDVPYTTISISHSDFDEIIASPLSQEIVWTTVQSTTTSTVSNELTLAPITTTIVETVAPQEPYPGAQWPAFTGKPDKKSKSHKKPKPSTADDYDDDFDESGSSSKKGHKHKPMPTSEYDLYARAAAETVAGTPQDLRTLPVRTTTVSEAEASRINEHLSPDALSFHPRPAAPSATGSLKGSVAHHSTFKTSKTKGAKTTGDIFARATDAADKKKKTTRYDPYDPYGPHAPSMMPPQQTIPQTVTCPTVTCPAPPAITPPAITSIVTVTATPGAFKIRDIPSEDPVTVMATVTETTFVNLDRRQTDNPSEDPASLPVSTTFVNLDRRQTNTPTEVSESLPVSTTFVNLDRRQTDNQSEDPVTVMATITETTAALPVSTTFVNLARRQTDVQSQDPVTVMATVTETATALPVFTTSVNLDRRQTDIQDQDPVTVMATVTETTTAQPTW